MHPMNYATNGLQNSDVASNQIPPKKKPGRPPETPKQKAAKALKLKAEIITDEPEILPAELVGPPGFEPDVVKPHQGPPEVQAPPPTPNLYSKKITKEDLVSGFQKIMEKEKSENPKLIDSNGNSLNGFKRVKDILFRFGVKKLGELDEKRYHEMNIHIEDALQSI